MYRKNIYCFLENERQESYTNTSQAENADHPDIPNIQKRIFSGSLFKRLGYILIETEHEKPNFFTNAKSAPLRSAPLL